MDIRIIDDRHIAERLTLPQWIAAFIFIELVWTFMGGGITHLFLEVTRNHLWSGTVWLAYVAQHVNFLILIGAVLFVVRYAVRIPIIRFMTDAPRFRWRLFRFSFLVWIGGISIATVVTFLFEPQSFMVHTTERIWERLLLMILALVLTPMQCIAEELLFRTTLWRMLEGRVRKLWIPAVISGIVFTIAHLKNVEVQSTANNLPVLLYYFLTGLLFMEMVRVHQGSEAAFGAHIANNIFLVLVVNYSSSSLASDPWFIQQDPIIWLEITVLVLCSTIIIRYGNSSRFKTRVDHPYR